ncbi:MAG: hypothetical protein ABFE07_23655, partial [Armatimonadia bacterium]
MRAIVAVIGVLACVLVWAQPVHAPAKPWETWQPSVVVLPNPNGFDTYLKAFALKSQIDQRCLPPDGLTPMPTDRWGEGPPEIPLEQRVALYAEVLDLARQAMTQECRIPPPNDFGDDLLPFYDGFGALARLFAMEAATYTQHNNWAGAGNSVLDCIQMAQNVATRRTLLAFLVASKIEEDGLSVLGDTASQLDAAQCKAALARLTNAEGRRLPIPEVIDGQERLARLGFVWWAKLPGFLGVFRTLPPPPYETSLGVDAVNGTASWQGLTDYFAAIRRLAEQPYLAKTKPVLPRDPLVANVAGDMGPVFFRDARVRTVAHLQMVMLAVRACTLEQGHTPATLQELVPTYIDRVPNDPFGTGPLKLRRNDQTYVIY